MASPSYDIDVVGLALAVVLAAAILFLLAQIVPQLTDLMMMPPPLSGAR
jgi:large-conductance mechanosensitive channel